LGATTLYEDAFSNSGARGVAFDGAGGVYLSGLGSGFDYRVLKDAYGPWAPALSSSPFTGVFGTSLTANWASTFPSGTQYQAQLSSTSDFSGSVASSATLNLSATFTGLALYATYYARVATAPGGPYTAVASTRTPLFTAVPVLGSGLISFGAAWGDYDKDGDLDAFVANTANMDALLLRNDGGGVLTQVVITALARNAGAVAWADADGDGDLDALLAKNSDSTGAVLLRNDGGTWTPATVSNTAGAGSAVAWGDYDNDGDPDGLLARDSAQDEVLRRNDGGVLTGVVLTGTGGDSKGAAWADYDGDGDLDALVSNAGSEVLLRNDGGTLTALTVADTAGNSAGVAWGDLDGDGLPEAVVSGDWWDDIAVLRSTAGVLVKTLLPATSGSLGVAVADFDADGDLDILAAASAVNTKEFLLRNDGGAFTKQLLEQTGDATSAVVWADYDTDGDLDALLANYDSSTDEILLRNDAAPYNPPPSAPAVESLVAEPGVSGGTLTLKWAAGAYDGAAPAAGLNFAVVMTTAPMVLSPDGLRVVSPSSFTVSWNYGSPLFGPYPRAAYRVWPGDATPKHGLYFRFGLGGAAANIRS
ncbi:MAG: VCBS repeat-containing protein, partial [Elusimicrobia bacterium]|nr:VCBS repeat-containing protein [Elusimicrobiota bacterium]